MRIADVGVNEKEFRLSSARQCGAFSNLLFAGGERVDLFCFPAEFGAFFTRLGKFREFTGSVVRCFEAELKLGGEGLKVGYRGAQQLYGSQELLQLSTRCGNCRIQHFLELQEDVTDAVG